jgi:hypothetical protein
MTIYNTVKTFQYASKLFIKKEIEHEVVVVEDARIVPVDFTDA